jgi:hypothetical protein
MRRLDADRRGGFWLARLEVRVAAPGATTASSSGDPRLAVRTTQATIFAENGLPSPER